MSPRPTFTLLRHFLSLFALALSVAANATTVLPLDLDQLVAGAREIVHARCIANQTQSDPVAGVATLTTFLVIDRAKGQPSQLLTVRQAGGTHNGQVVDFRVPKFKPGDEYVLFLPAPSAAGFASPVGLTQGAFAVSGTAAGRQVGNGRDFSQLMPGAAAAAAPENAGARAQAATAAQSRMDLGDFMTIVRAKAVPK